MITPNQTAFNQVSLTKVVQKSFVENLWAPLNQKIPANLFLIKTWTCLFKEDLLYQAQGLKISMTALTLT